MVISHNLQAMNANRQLNKVSGNRGKTTERLSSGYRINRAGDDAAGLSISEKMRSQIRGLNKALENAETGISVAQTAEGAMNEVHSILQRMNELATQAANDTNTKADRSQLQLEIDQLVSEIDRISSTTQFNTMNLLDGSFTGKNLQVGAISGQNIELSISSLSASGLGLVNNDLTITVTSNLDITVSDEEAAAVNDRFSYLTKTIYGEPFVSTAGNAATFSATLTQAGRAAFAGDPTRHYLFYLEEGTPYNGGTVSPTGWYELKDSRGGQVMAKELIQSDAVDLNNMTGFVRVTSGAPANMDHIEARGGTAVSRDCWEDQSGNLYTTSEFQSSFGLSFSGTPTVGSYVDISTTGGKISVSSFAKAGDAMKRVQDAIDKVSTERAKLGAIQNRLEHTIYNLGSTEENSEAAESRLRDTDMAAETVRFSRDNILSQAGQAMLAQANRSTESVLSLLA